MNNTRAHACEQAREKTDTSKQTTLNTRTRATHANENLKTDRLRNTQAGQPVLHTALQQLTVWDGQRV